MSKFKPGQKVVCARPETIVNPIIIKIPKGDTVTVSATHRFNGRNFYSIEEYLLGTFGKPAYYDESHFEPLISTTQQFVEVTYTKIIETAPKTCSS